MVGITGFEPVTSRPPGARATKLRYIPNDLQNEFYNNEFVMGHELIHTFQYEQSFGLNAYLDKPLKKIEKKKEWFKRYQSVFHTEYSYLLDRAIYSLEKVPDKKLYEKEAVFYTE